MSWRLLRQFPGNLPQLGLRCYPRLAIRHIDSYVLADIVWGPASKLTKFSIGGYEGGLKEI